MVESSYRTNGRTTEFACVSWAVQRWEKKMTTKFVRVFGLRSLVIKFALLALAVILPACSSTASLTVTWTIASSSDASSCSQYGATSIAILVNNASGNEYGRVTPECSAMTTTFSNVPNGTYTVSAQMLDASGNPITGTIGPDTVTISSGTNAAQNINFPATAFTNSGTGSGTGSLAVNWTIESSLAVSECSKYNAANTSINLTDSNGSPYGTTTLVACAAQTATVANLSSGTYGVAAKMVDGSGQAVSTTATASVVITAGTTTRQSFDFPASSFTSSNP